MKEFGILALMILDMLLLNGPMVVGGDDFRICTGQTPQTSPIATTAAICTNAYNQICDCNIKSNLCVPAESSYYQCIGDASCGDAKLCYANACPASCTAPCTCSSFKPDKGSYCGPCPSSCWV